jgi:hypothetical protein
MFDAECDLAALVYGPDQDPDAVLRDFAAGLKAQGIRAVGMVSAGCTARPRGSPTPWKRALLS